MDATNEITFKREVPIFRIFSIEKAREFYVDYLGFKIDWEHRFEPGLPVYMQISLGNLQIHLSENHGDACPGSCLFVELTGIERFHAALQLKAYAFMRPGLEDAEWGARYFEVIDPFGNKIRFNEYKR